MDRVHKLMLDLKQSSALPEHIQFAGGNGLGEMFIRLREGFADSVARVVDMGTLPVDADGTPVVKPKPPVQA